MNARYVLATALLVFLQQSCAVDLVRFTYEVRRQRRQLIVKLYTQELCRVVWYVTFKFRTFYSVERTLDVW